MKAAMLVPALWAIASAASTLQRADLESLSAIPEGWERVEAAVPLDKRLFFHIGLKQSDPQLFKQTINDVSDPSNAKYGQHLSHAELKRLVAPAQEATNSVLQWLVASGVEEDDIEDDGDFINFVTTTAKANAMMDTSFDFYKSIAGHEKVRTLQYSLPSDLMQYIETIQPTTRFGQIRPQFSWIRDKQVIGKVGEDRISTASASVNATCEDAITPQCLQELYNINGFTPDRSTAGFIGVNGFLNQFARYSDLQKFANEYAPFVKNASFDWTSVAGGQLNQSYEGDATEANLDIQYTVSLTYPMRNNFYSTAGLGYLIPDLDQPSQADNQNEPYLDLFTYVSNLPDDQLPHTLSTSYGEDEQSVPANYSQKVCDLIGGLGARGVSVIFSSGDTGVGSACQTNDGKNTTRFLPIFPAACPYVTSVGGTTGIGPESAVGFSSGGFSDRWATPDYQKDAVQKYLGILGGQWEGLYNPSGRGFPDVAAQSENFHVITQNYDTLVGGTSAAAPAFAGIIALLNAARLEKGLPALGFLNPFLYQNGVEGLNDVTTGGSSGCSGIDIYSGLKTPEVPNASWNATEGWDPVTGLGTPDFSKLLNLVTTNVTNSTVSKRSVAQQSVRRRQQRYSSL